MPKPHELKKGIRVGIDEQIIHKKLLEEMRFKNGISETYVKQCIEANRHNAATAYYNLLLKSKILAGEKFDDET